MFWRLFVETELFGRRMQILGTGLLVLGLIHGSWLPGMGQQPSLWTLCRCLWLCQESKVKLLAGCLLLLETGSFSSGRLQFSAPHTYWWRTSRYCMQSL